MPTFTMTGWEQFGQKFKDRIKAAIETANERSAAVAGDVASLAKEYCPEREGQLMDSIEVVQSESGLKQGRDDSGRFSQEAIITYTVKAGGPDVPHALAVHENPSRHDPPTWKGKNINFRKGGSHFLARAFRDYDREFRTRVMKKLFVVIVGLLWGCRVAAGQGVVFEPVEEPKEPVKVEVKNENSQIGVFAAVWCKVVSKREDKSDTTTQIDPDTGEPIEEPANEEVSDFNGCDAGFAASLVNLGRAHWVAVIGTSSIGTGFAWSISKTGTRPMAVAIGIMANYDSKGIYSDTLALTLGATVSLRGLSQ